MINQTPSTIDQHKKKEPNFKKIKQIHFLIGFISISLLSAFIIGGFFIGKDNVQKEKQIAAVTLEEQVDLDPVSLPGNPENWTTYKFESLKIEFKLPEELNKKSDWVVKELNGTTGKSICFSDQEIKNDKDCKIGDLIIVATSNDFSSEENITFLDSQGFEAKDKKYFVKSLSDEKFELTDTIFKFYENNESFEIIKIVGKDDESSGINSAVTRTPGDGYLGAIVNTKNLEYPAIVIRMKINSDISEYEFDQILESLKFIN